MKIVKVKRKDKIIQGDTLEVLKTFPDNFVDTIITSPPYWGLRDYGIKGQIGLEKTLDEYINKLLLITAELKRVLKPSGVMFWNHGDCYGGNLSAPNQPKLGKRDPYSDFPRVRARGRTPKCLCLQNYRLIIQMINQGWILRNTIIWHKPNHMPSSVKDRFTNAYEPVFMLVKNNNPVYHYNIKTGLMADKSISIKKGKEGIDWDWKPCPSCNTPQGETKIEPDKAEKLSSPRARYHRKCKNKRCVNGKIKRSYWNAVKYWFDLDAVRVPHKQSSLDRIAIGKEENRPQQTEEHIKGVGYKLGYKKLRLESAGKNPGDVWEIRQDERAKEARKKGMITFYGHSRRYSTGYKHADDVWRIPTQPFPEAHFATFPEKLIEPMILSSCPRWICKKCGKARIRITERESIERIDTYEGSKHRDKEKNYSHKRLQMMVKAGRAAGLPHDNPLPPIKTIGWTDCNCKAGWKSGIVLDPFIGSGTVAVVAERLKRNYIGIELSPDYIKIAQQRIKKQPVPLL